MPDQYSLMPPEMATRARNNVRAVDRIQNRFNQRAANVPQFIGNPALVSGQPQSVPTLTLGGTMDTGLNRPELPSVNAVSRMANGQAEIKPIQSASPSAITNVAVNNPKLALASPETINRLLENFGWGRNAK